MKKKSKISIKSIIANGLIAIVFWVLAIILYIIDNNIFYLINFGYIGTAIGTGFILYTVLPREKKHIGRKISQFLVGSYLFIFLGIIIKLNIQLEGVWFEFLFGVGTAPIMHYLIAKIFGTPIIGRIYCGWACWTAMILDLFPYKESRGRVKGKWGNIRYIHFALSIGIVLLAWFVFGYMGFEYFKSSDLSDKIAYVSTEYSLLWFIIGNVLYYSIGIVLALVLKDNRAFCKYVCPITTFLKAGSRFSIIKIKGRKDECTSCGKCIKSCPMDINIPEYIKSNKRVTSTECILCQTCKDNCVTNTLKLSVGFDGGLKEYLVKRK